MRIRLNGVLKDYIPKMIDEIASRYGIEVGAINLYVSFHDEDNLCNIYDAKTLNPTYIDLTKNVTLEKRITKSVCFTANNYEFVSNIMMEVSGWKKSVREMVSNYLISEYSLKDKTISANDKIPEESREEIKSVVDSIMNQIGIYPDNYNSEDDSFEDYDDELIEDEKENDETEDEKE